MPTYIKTGSYSDIPIGSFICENNPVACGYGPEGGGGIIGALIGLVFLCMCIGVFWFICKSAGGDDHSDSHGSERIEEHVVVETKVIEEYHHNNDGGY